MDGTLQVKFILLNTGKIHYNIVLSGYSKISLKISQITLKSPVAFHMLVLLSFIFLSAPHLAFFDAELFEPLCTSGLTPKGLQQLDTGAWGLRECIIVRRL